MVISSPHAHTRDTDANSPSQTDDAPHKRNQDDDTNSNFSVPTYNVSSSLMKIKCQLPAIEECKLIIRYVPMVEFELCLKETETMEMAIQAACFFLGLNAKGYIFHSCPNYFGHHHYHSKCSHFFLFL
jgi:hypothetical protein